MALKTYRPTYIARWRADTRAYIGANTPITAGGPQGHNTFLGFPSQMRDDIKASKTPVTIRVSLYVTRTGEFDVGAHRTASNPRTNGIPYYYYIGLHPILQAGGRRTIDITSFRNDFLNNGFHGVVLYSQIGTTLAEAHGLTGDSYEVRLEVEGTWNNPPTAPGVTYPKGGETLNGFVNLTGTRATDPDGDALRYQWAIYDGTWHYFSTGAIDTITKNVDFSKYNETSRAQVALRAYDGQAYGPWAYSDVFTIRHNIPPKAPTSLNPTGGAVRDRSAAQQLRWIHNDTDSQSKFDLRWRERGAATWNTITRETFEQFYTAPGGTFPEADIEWQVRTYDSFGEVSPYSGTAIFRAASPADRPVITEPRAGTMVNVPRPVIAWSSADQVRYELEIRQGTTTIWTSGQRTSPNKAQTVGQELQNNSNYSARVRVANSAGIWGAWATVNFSTSFTPPPRPTLTITENNERGSLEIRINNPEPGTGEPAVSHNEIYRRRAGETDWERVTEPIQTNGTWTDYTPAARREYEYFARAFGVNDSYSDGEPNMGRVTFHQVILQKAADPSEWTTLLLQPSKSFDRTLSGSTLEFVGRTRPVAQFGTMENYNADLSFMVYDQETLEAAERILTSKETLLYRDRRGRRMFCVVFSYTVKDLNPDEYEIAFRPQEIDYKEGEA